MYRPLLGGLILAALSSGTALAAPLPAGDPPLDPPAEGPGPGPDGGSLHVHPGGPGGGPGPRGPVQEVIGTTLEIERLYREQGKPREVIALYQDLLAKAKNPEVRGFAYEALAHAELQPADPDRAITTLKQGLEESLQRLNQLPQPHGPDVLDGHGPDSPDKGP